MTNISIKQSLTEEERKVVAKQSLYGFYPSPGPIEELEKNREYQKESYELILFEDDRPVTSAQSIPMIQNVRNKIFKMAGIAMVITYPEGRRKGYVKQLMELFFQDMKSKKQCVSTLLPFKQSFYEKLGYVTFPQLRTAIISPSAFTPLLKHNFGGKINRQHLKDSVTELQSIEDKCQRQIHGFSLFYPLAREAIKNLQLWLVTITDEQTNEVIGTMTYKITGFEDKLVIRDFLYLNSKAKYIMFQMLGRHEDQIKEIIIPLKPFEFIENWFYNLKAKINTRKFVPSHMGRVIIISELSGMQVGEGEISINIIDKQCEWNNGTWIFKSVDGLLKVENYEDSECILTIQGLSALIYGGHDPSDFYYRGWGSPSLELQDRMKKLFPSISPFVYSNF